VRTSYKICSKCTLKPVDLVSFVLLTIVVLVALPEMFSWRGSRDEWAKRNGYPPVSGGGVDGGKSSKRPVRLGAPPFYEYQEDGKIKRVYPGDELYETIYRSIR